MGKVRVRVKEAKGLKRFLGLMFRSKDTENLVFNFKEPTDQAIHSYFVFFPFVALWLDEKNRIMESRMIGTFKENIRPKSKFCRLVEIPLNRKNVEILKELNL